MADFYGTSRSNYFKVKDNDKFEALCEKMDVEFIESDGRVGFLCSKDQFGGFPSFIEDEDFDFVIEVSKHLIEDEVAIFMMAGAEKHRYVQGIAIAVNSKGEVEQVDTSDIYQKAKKLGKNITEASY